MAILEFAFMRRALLVGILLAVVIPCIGLVVVLKRLSMIGDALSHSSLAGVAAGLLLGGSRFSFPGRDNPALPVLCAMGASVIAALAIEWIRKRFPKYAEMAVAIVMSAGVGLAGVLSGFVDNASSFNSFLFGSIVAITSLEAALAVAVSIVVMLAVLLLYRELFYISFDERLARLAGVPVRAVNLIFVLLTALTTSIAARIVGALIVSSMMVVPVACGMQLGRSYRGTLMWSILFAVGFTLTGLVLSYYNEGLRPGGAIVLTGVASLALLLGAKRLRQRGAG